MKVFEVVEKISIKTSQADVAKMKDINARMQQALKTGDADAGFMAGAELGDILQNKLYPDLLAVSAYIVNELEKGCAKYSKKDPKWNQACKELPQTKMAILKQIHGQGLKPFQGSKKSGEKIVNIFGKSYLVPAGASKQNVGEDMNAIVAKQGKKKHGQKYMDAARQMAQEKGRKLTPDERDKLRDKHSDNRKQANETTSGSIGSVAQNMTPGKMISRNMYNSNGTMKNGLDYGNILGGPSQPKKAKKRRV